MPTPTDPLRPDAVRAAGLLLARAAELMPSGESVTVVSDGIHEVRVVVAPVRYGLADPEGAAVADPAPSPPPPPHLTPLERLILRHAPIQPVTLRRLARLCDHDPDSYFRTRVRRLHGLGLLSWDFRGYRLPDSPLTQRQSGAETAGPRVG